MAGDIKAVLQVPKPVNFYSLTQEPPTVYVDSWQIGTSASDVKVKLGDIVERNEDEQVSRLAFTIAMTHDSFINFANAINSVAEFLKESYDGKPPSNSNLTPERFAEIAAKLSINQ
jgi:hypothetical protein